MATSSDYAYFRIDNITDSTTAYQRFVINIERKISSHYQCDRMNNTTYKYTALLFHRTDNANGERPFVVFYIGEYSNKPAIGAVVKSTAQFLVQGKGVGFGVFDEEYSATMKNDILNMSNTAVQFREALMRHNFVGTSSVNSARKGLVGARTRCLEYVEDGTGRNKYRLTSKNVESRIVKHSFVTSNSGDEVSLGISTCCDEFGVAIYIHECHTAGTIDDSRRFGVRFAFVNQANGSIKSAFAVKYQDSDDNAKLRDYDCILEEQLFTYIKDGDIQCSSPVTKNQENLSTLNYASSIWDNIPYENELPDAHTTLNLISIPLYMIYNAPEGLRRVRVDSELFRICPAKYGTAGDLTGYKLGKTPVCYFNNNSSWKWQGGIVISK